MSKIEKHAIILASEMVEHNLKNGASVLDLDYIAKDACELAYKIHELSKKYGVSEDVSDINKMIDDRIKKHTPKNMSVTNQTTNHE